jgi:hypothetical protein
MVARISREMRLVMLFVLGAGLLAVIITIIVVSAARAAYPQTPASQSTDVDAFSSLDISDFQFPDDYTQTWKPTWYASRDQQSHWTWEEVQKYWIDPRTSVIRSLKDQNDKKIDKLLSGAP